MTIAVREKVYTLDVLRDEARALVDRGCLTRQQPICMLCRYISDGKWKCFEVALAENEFLLRDRIIDLLSEERWEEDA
ncbi:MAG: DUF4327 family protein [Cyanobacteria bacterium J06621_11]